MATGYTMPIHDNEPITFEQFVLRCSREMGAAIMQRDESPDVEIRERTLDDHYVANVEKSAAKLQEAIDRPLSEWAALQDEAIAEATAQREKYLAEKEALESRYHDMLSKVVAWKPPTADHIGLKDFMVEQLKSSIEFDCGDFTPPVPVRTSPDLYAQQEIARLTKVHSNHVRYLGEERERVAGQNAWVRALRASLTP